MLDKAEPIIGRIAAFERPDTKRPAICSTYPGEFRQAGSYADHRRATHQGVARCGRNCTHRIGGHGDNPPTGLAEPPAELVQALERDFGSVAAWRAEFTAMAKALAGGAGLGVLAWSERLGRLVNQWAADHAHGLPGATPILALDMYEHAYHLDFGAKAAAYVDQAMVNLNWERIGARHRLANRHGSAGRRPVPPVRRPGAGRGADFGRGAQARARE